MDKSHLPPLKFRLLANGTGKLSIKIRDELPSPAKRARLFITFQLGIKHEIETVSNFCFFAEVLLPSDEYKASRLHEDEAFAFRFLSNCCLTPRQTAFTYILFNRECERERERKGKCRPSDTAR